MKIALVQGYRRPAYPAAEGSCQCCGHTAFSKCGNERVWHWAHKSRRLCDPWWENETEWHRTWKDQFPEEWQEFAYIAPDGERHIADVKTDRGWVLEFQHSPLTQAERQSRNNFYPKILWVVNGARSKRNWEQFQKAWDETGTSVGMPSNVRKLWTGDSRLLQEWTSSAAPTFFDFGNANSLWWLQGQTSGWSHVAQISRLQFIDVHNGRDGTDFDALVSTLKTEFARYNMAERRTSINSMRIFPLPRIRRSPSL